jgi:hypothetical protein
MKKKGNLDFVRDGYQNRLKGFDLEIVLQL